MDRATIDILNMLARIIASLGPSGIWSIILGFPVLTLLPVFVIAVIYSKRQDNFLEAYRKDTQEVLKEYGQAVDKLGAYYKDNVILVKNYERITNDLHSVVMLNTQTMQRLCDRIEGATK